MPMSAGWRRLRWLVLLVLLLTVFGRLVSGLHLVQVKDSDACDVPVSLQRGRTTVTNLEPFLGIGSCKYFVVSSEHDSSLWVTYMSGGVSVKKSCEYLYWLPGFVRVNIEGGNVTSSSGLFRRSHACTDS